MLHSLNLLRTVFRDSVLAQEASVYLARALLLALAAFAHPFWAVRNSALMAYSAMLARALRLQYHDPADSAAQDKQQLLSNM